MGESFESETPNRPYCIPSNQSQLILILRRTMVPPGSHPRTDHFLHQLYHLKKSNPHPPDFLANVYSKRPNLFSFKDPNFKELFESKSMDKAVLDSLVFKDSTPIGPH